MTLIEMTTCDCNHGDRGTFVTIDNPKPRTLWCDKCDWQERCEHCDSKETGDDGLCDECEFEKQIAAADAAMDRAKEGW